VPLSALQGPALQQHVQVSTLQHRFSMPLPGDNRYVACDAQVPQGVKLPNWDAGTLTGGKYTVRSEMYQIGRLLLECRRLLEAGQEFTEQLLSKRLSL
jgi:hypothetical protein